MPSTHFPASDHRLQNADSATIDGDDPGPTDNGETTALLSSINKKQKTRIPKRFRQKSYLALFVGGVIVVVAVLLAALGAIGKLTTRNKDSDSPKDGLSPPWYPTPPGGTVLSWADSYKKAKSLVEKMTLVEKVNVTTGIGWQMGLCVGNTGPATSVGFPSLCLQDGPLGIRFADNITAFPAGVTVAATWDRELMYRRGKALGEEARLKGVNVLLGPSVGPIGSLPAGGRNWEGFGSDPVLQGIAAAETIRGIQANGVMATAKHYVLNEQEHFRMPNEWGIPHALSANIDDRTLHEVYIWPFADSVRAGVASVMCSYQMINNSYGCSNSLLMNRILKNELGFQGFVQSDWWAQQSGVASALAGLDMTMPGGGPRTGYGTSYWGGNLTLAALNASLPMERLNDMVTRIVAAWYQLNQDSWPKPPPDGDGGPNFSSWTKEEVGRLHQGSDDDDAIGVVNKFVNAQGNHSLVVRTVAAESTVLLKNEGGFLPLSRDGPTSDGKKYRVGIFGEDAGPGKGPNFCRDRGCNQGTLASGWGSGAVDFPYLITPWKALKEAFSNETVAISGYLTNEVADEDLVDQDLCIVFANADAGEGYLSDSDIHGDRNDLRLQKDTDKLVQRVAKKCGNGAGSTVVVIHSVGPVILESWIELPGIQAVLLANLPGQESGNSLVDVLFGDVDASGRLPYTIGRSEDDYGPDSKVLYKALEPVPQKNFSHGLYIDYRYFDKHGIAPRYEFGFGLSYTSFSLSNLIISPLQEKSALPRPRPAVPEVLPPTYDNTIPDPRSALFPDEFRRLSKYIYPYINSVDDVRQGKYPYPEGYDTAQPPSPAGGGEGGNPSLYELFVNVTVTVQNTGPRTGKEVVQLYLSFPDNVTDVLDGEDEERGLGQSSERIDFPVRVLRNFQKVQLAPEESTTVEMSLTRRDLSYWSSKRQNWVMPVKGKFRIWVGRSSRDLPLSGEF
ncbi:hypothetical protein VTO42DRAFT_3003 [Malbranchea cinnamomea]